MEEFEQNQLWKERREINSISTYFFLSGIVMCFILNKGFYVMLLFIGIIIVKSILGMFFEDKNQKAYIVCLVLTNIFYLFSFMIYKGVPKRETSELENENQQLKVANEELYSDNTLLVKELEELKAENDFLENKIKKLSIEFEENDEKGEF